jgi:CO dehydrogenase maturation factor
MRLAVTGKGGSGKTTVAATLARVFARRGHEISALDNDPNPNLAAALGVTREQAARLRRVPREDLFEERTDASGSTTLHLTRPFGEVVDEYGVRGPDDIAVLTLTGLLGAGKGCICGQHAAVRELLGELGDGQPNTTHILDMEASLEHLSRGTVRNVDALLVVAEPYYRSLVTVERIVPLAHELGLERVWLVANKIRNERDAAEIDEFASRHGFEVMGRIPFDDSVVEADRGGRALIDHAPNAPAVKAIEDLADRITNGIGEIAAVGG